MRENNLVRVYRRVLKYPPFGLKRKAGPMKIEHLFGPGEKVVSSSPEWVTVEDAEVIYSVFFLVQKGRARTFNSNVEKIDIIAVETSMSEIAKLLNSNNYERIWQSLRRLKFLTIEYQFPLGKMIMSILHKTVWDKADNSILILFDRQFFELCSKKQLTLNLDVFLTLRGAAKNLYSFLVSNSATEFNERLLIERTCIEAAQTNKARAILINALKNITTAGIIKGYKKVRRNGRWIYVIERQGIRELSPAGSKNYPPQGQNRPQKNPANT